MFYESKILAKKYACAFLNIFSDQLQIDDAEQCDAAAKFLQQHHDFFSLVQAPFISKSKQVETLKKLFDRYKLPAVFQKLSNLLLTTNRIFLLIDVLQAVAHEYRKRNNYELFAIESSHELSAQDRAVLVEYLTLATRKKIIPEYILNKDLIAGVRLQSATLLWEHSIEQQLHIIKRAFIRQELGNGY